MAVKKHSDIAYLVARVGGWDGIALQAELWLKLLLSMRKKITLITGEVETSPGHLDLVPFNKVDTKIIPELALAHQKELYIISFKRRYDRDVWVDMFIREKRKIKKHFKQHIGESPIVILHNFSIKHLIPAAWAAMYELMIENKDKQFISLAADSPFERSYLMEKFHPDVLRVLGNPKIWYKKKNAVVKERLKVLDRVKDATLPGPDKAPNLKYIVLNSNQKKIFHNIYGIPDNDLYAIPDMGRFKKENVKKKTSPAELEKFFKYIGRHQLSNKQKELNSEYTYFISPVRPIRRKKLLEIVYLCKLFEDYTKRRKKHRKVVLVITHPNRDEKPYFKEIKRYTRKLGLTFVFLGDEIKLRKREDEKDVFTYDEIMATFSNLDSICIVGSKFGGWENGILEASEHNIPVCVNPLLPSFQDMTALGYNYVATPIMIFSDLARVKFSEEYLQFPSITEFFRLAHKRIFDKKSRKDNANHNYKIGYRKQSNDITKKELRKLIQDSTNKLHKRKEQKELKKSKLTLIEKITEKTDADEKTDFPQE